MMKDSYRNPFSGVNAVQLTEDKILEYWCNPFIYDLYTEIKESDIYEDEMNIIIMGGRSTGKSMFLRYWSFPVQMKIAEKDNTLFKNKIKDKKGIGFYFRIDGPKLKSFSGNDLSDDYWSALFANYFELIVGRKYIEVLKVLNDENTFGEEKLQVQIINELCQIISFEKKDSVEDIIIEFDERIKEIELYLGNVPFYKKPIEPKHQIYLSRALSFSIPNFFHEKIQFFHEINFVILLDEYENFLEYQQKTVNTLLRFTESKIKFRIAMRLEGFRTFDMISEDDFIKVGREYREVVLEEVVNIKGKTSYTNFLLEVSKKRLESVPILAEKGFTDIKRFLSDKEDIEKDALELVKGKEDILINFFENRGVNLYNLNKVRYSENPLMELLNFVLLTRNRKVDEVKQSMNDYIKGEKTELEKKYHNDYINKYKLSLYFLLCSIYRTNKPYYSFNTFAFLSSGIVGHFIELCRISFDEAGWGNNEKLINEGIISKDFQNRAAIKLSVTEKRQINRIEVYGGTISRFVENIGSLFRHYHLDPKLRYPETNQFAISLDTIQDPFYQNALRAAIKWTVIQKKSKPQRSAPSESLQELYTLNRIFSPNFQISYRTRGGKSIFLNEENIIMLMTAEKINFSNFLPDDDDQSKDNSILSLFPDL